MNIAKYLAYVGTSSSGTDVHNGTHFSPTNATADSTTSTITITGLSSNTTYYVKIAQCAQSNHNSATSSEVSSTTPNS